MQQRQHAGISRLRRIASIGSICLVVLCACGGGGGVNTPAPIAPSITVQPTSLSVRAGQPATFSVTADGDAPLTYQWQRNGVNVADGTAASYTLAGTLMADSGSTWTATVSNATASVTSTPATLTVTAQAGTISVAAIIGPSSNSQSYLPTYQAVDGKGNLYVYSQVASATLLKITPAGVTSVLASNLASNFMVMGLTVAADGTVYLLELDYSRVFMDLPSMPSSWGAFVRKISPEGVVTTIADAGSDNPKDLSLDAAGNVYWHSHMGGIVSVRKCTPTGVITTIAVGSGDLAHQTMDKLGNLYGTQSHYGYYAYDSTGSIIKVSPDGKFSTLAGSTVESGTADGPGTNARFGALGGMALDSAGNVYVADSSYNTIRKISPGGFVSTVAGKAGSDGIVLGALPGGLSKVSSLAMGADGLLYVYSNNTILKIQFAD